MNAASSQGFKFRIEDDPPEHCLEADEDDIRIARLNRRVTWVALLVPCLAGLLLAAGYLDLKGRLEGIDRAGVEEMQALAKGLDARVSALAGQHDAAGGRRRDRRGGGVRAGGALIGLLAAGPVRARRPAGGGGQGGRLRVWTGWTLWTGWTVVDFVDSLTR